MTEKAVLDGTSPPVQTIIFENTNYKSTPELAMKAKFSNHIKNPRIDKVRGEHFVVFVGNNYFVITKGKLRMKFRKLDKSIW